MGAATKEENISGNGFGFWGEKSFSGRDHLASGERKRLSRERKMPDELTTASRNADFISTEKERYGRSRHSKWHSSVQIGKNQDIPGNECVRMA